MAAYQPGDTVRLATTFTVGGVLTDPTAVTLAVRDPLAVTTSYTYPPAGTIVRPSVGAFQADVAVATAGIWRWRWVGTGAAAGVDEGAFTVDGAIFTTAILTTVDAVKRQTESTSTEDDDLIDTLIVAASAAIMTYTEREFAGPGVPETRTFPVGARWDSVYGVHVGDLRATPTAITVLDADGVSTGTVTPATHVNYLPVVRTAGEPITRLTFRSTASAYPSDGYYLQVTGLWGWPTVPADVQQAAVLTVREWLSKSDAEWGMPSGLSTGGDTSSAPTRYMLPYAAKQLLQPYRRIAIAVY